MNVFRVAFWALTSLFVLSSCGGSAPAPDSADSGNGEFSILVSINSENRRAEMTVTDETTFADVRAFASSELNLTGQNFDLKIAGKKCEDSELLSDHGINAPAQPMSMPVGNVLVRLKD